MSTLSDSWCGVRCAIKVKGARCAMTVILHALFIYVAYAVSYRSSEEILPSLRDHAAAEFVHHTGSTWPHGGPHHPAAGPARCPPDLGQQLPHWQYRGLLDHRTAERIPTRTADDGAYGGKYRLSKPPQCCRVTMSNCRYARFAPVHGLRSIGLFGLQVDLRCNEVERQLWATLRPYPFGVTSFIPCCSNNETCSAVNLNSWPSGIRSADTGYFGRRGVDAGDAELLAPGAELAAVIGGGKPKGLGQRLEPKPLGIKSAAIRQGDRDAEGGIEPPAQVGAGDVARLDH